MAGKVIHCGESGAGQAAKLCNNMVLAVQQIAIGEAFVLAEKLGLPAQSLFDVITGATGNCWAVHTNCPVPGPVPTSPANNDFKPGFATALMNKDLGLAMAAVELDGIVGAAGHAMPPRSTPSSTQTTPTRTSAPSSSCYAAEFIGEALGRRRPGSFLPGVVNALAVGHPQSGADGVVSHR